MLALLVAWRTSLSTRACVAGLLLSCSWSVAAGTCMHARTCGDLHAYLPASCMHSRPHAPVRAQPSCPAMTSSCSSRPSCYPMTSSASSLASRPPGGGGQGAGFGVTPAPPRSPLTVLAVAPTGVVPGSRVWWDPGTSPAPAPCLSTGGLSFRPPPASSAAPQQ